MTAAPNLDTRFRLAEQHARSLAGQFGTPLYVLSEEGFKRRIRRFQSTFEALGVHAEVAYASKANSTLALMALAHANGCRLDVASEGEFRAALAAGAKPERCYLHGNNKSRRELEFAIEQGIGQIVADNFRELETLRELYTGLRGERVPGVAIRLAPGVDPVTHHKISTGQADTKFGFNIADGAAERAVETGLEFGLPLIGFHCHVGSQLMDAEAQRAGAELIAGFAVRMQSKHGLRTTWLSVGGGLGARYLDSDLVMEVETYVREVVNGVRAQFDGTDLEPVLIFEPGRALAAEEGVTLYEVGVVKTVNLKDGGTRTYACVNGGLADNPRPALYGARYTVERVSPNSGEANELFTISGRHCETDLLFKDVLLPKDLAPGDLLQVLCTGAYSASMASNYNRYPRPAAVLIRESGEAVLVQRQESFEEMFAREILPPGLGG